MTKIPSAIYFDMDGTLADLYSVANWEYRLNNSDPTPYQEAEPIIDMEELKKICNQFIETGITIGIISWLAKDSNKEYDKQVRAAKRKWLDDNFPCASELHFIKHGTTKRSVAKHKDSILVDDNDQVLKGWHGTGAIDAKGDIIEELKKILKEINQSAQYRVSIIENESDAIIESYGECDFIEAMWFVQDFQSHHYWGETHILVECYQPIGLNPKTGAEQSITLREDIITLW